MKKVLYLVAVLIALSLLPAPGYRLVDLVTERSAEGFSISWPFWRYLLEPAVAVGAYVLSLSRYMLQLSSWLFWVALLTAAAGAARRMSAGRTARAVFLGWTVVLTAVVASLLLPLPAPRLEAPPGTLTADLHSHTFYSHDGTAGPQQSLGYHRALGFDVFFNTEHNHARGFARYPVEARYTRVFPGMQMSTTEKISLLVFADRDFVGEDFSDMTIRELIDEAHARGFVVVCPHWWKWRYPEQRQLADWGIDGFEIYNAGYRTFSDADRRDMVRLCSERGLLMTGSTDWHGWGRMSNVWTVFDRGALREGESFAGYLRTRPRSRVIRYGRDEADGRLRYLFEPFYSVYCYFGSMGPLQTASWAVWLTVGGWVLSSARRRKALRVLPLLISLGLAAGALYYLYLWLPLRAGNDILGRLLVPVLGVLSLFWFTLWRMYGKDTDKA